MPNPSTIRKEIWKLILDLLKKNPEISFNKTAAKIAVQIGWTKQKVISLLRLLEDADEIMIENDKIRICNAQVSKVWASEDQGNKKA